MSFVWPTSHVGMAHPFAANVRARTQGLLFLRMAEAAERGLSYDEAKRLFPNVDAATVETRKSLYEEFGLLYVPKYSGTLHLTPVGKQLFNLLGTRPPTRPSEDLLKRVDVLLCWAMSHAQINRPQSLGSPNITAGEREACNIRPYAAFWQAMLKLGGTITFEEFSNVLAHVQVADNFLPAIQVIRRARRSGELPRGTEKSGNFGIYWRAHLSLAGAVLNIENGQFSFVPNREESINSILQFQMTREPNDPLAAIRSKTWANVDEYFLYSGQACPDLFTQSQGESPPSLTIPFGTTPTVTPTARVVALQPQRRQPLGTGSAPAINQGRGLPRVVTRSQVPAINDPLLSQQAEDLAERTILRPQYGDRLIRVGHTRGETIALPNDIVPGADFYIVSNGSPNPIGFVEIKSVTGCAPFDISLTRAEYLRAIRCAEEGIPYRLILVNVATVAFYEVDNFATNLQMLQISEVIQITIRIA